MLAVAPNQPLYINCPPSQPVMLPQYPQFSPYLHHQDPSSFYQPIQQPPQPMPVFVSPNSSGRFDTEYESDASGSFAGRSPPAPTQLPIYHYPQPEQVNRKVPLPLPIALQAGTPDETAAWRDKFVENFSSFSIGTWHLKVVYEPPDLHNAGFARHLWRYRLEKATRVNFLCTICGSSAITSGQTVFWIYKDDATNTGYIHQKLYERRCPNCQSSAKPHWPMRDIHRALDGLYEHVAQNYYGVSTEVEVQAKRSRNQSFVVQTLIGDRHQWPQTRLPC